MKLKLNQQILSANNKPIMFKESDIDGKEVEKEMTVRDVLSIILVNSEPTTDDNILDGIDVFNRKLITAMRKKKDYIEINSKFESSFITDMIKKDAYLTNIMKGFVLGMIVNGGSVDL